jgi:hypothetical protein
MADGELCKYCGQQETVHEYPDLCDDPSERIPGYRTALVRCKGFVSEEPPQESDPKADEFYFEAMDRRAAGRAAFGLYSACVRQANLDEELARIEAEGGSDVEERKQKHIESQRTGLLYIG